MIRLAVITLLITTLISCSSPKPADQTDRPASETPSSRLTVEEALRQPIGARFTVGGSLLSEGDGWKLCEALAEALPPQCMGASVVVTSVQEDWFDTARSGKVSWTGHVSFVARKTSANSLIAVR